MSKKEVWRKISLMLAMVLAIGQVFAFDGAVLQAQAVQETESKEADVNTQSSGGKIVNGDFSSDWDGWDVKVNGADITVSENKIVKIVDAESGSGFDEKCVEINAWDAGDNEFSLEQTIKNVEAGEYQITFRATGDNSGGLDLYVNDEKTSLGSFASAWGNPKTYRSKPITLESTSDIKVKLKGTIPDGFWCLMKDFAIEEAVEEPDAPAGLIKNGSFEDGWESWSVSVNGVHPEGDKTGVEFDNGGGFQGDFINIYSEDSIEFSLGQTIENMEAGTYKITFKMAGELNKISGLGLYIDGDAVNSNIKLKGTWDYPAKYISNTIVVPDDGDINFELKGIIPANCWIALDDFQVSEYEKEDEEIIVEKVEGIDGDFIKGVDISSYISEIDSGVVFRDWEGNALESEQEFFDLLKDAGINYVRLRVWNDPYLVSGNDVNGYGGGNNDVEKAIRMGQWATNAGMQVLVDFHYSDFWADPPKWKAPKAWEEMTVANKAEALGTFTKDTLEEMIAKGVDVGMVQVGNETNNGLASVSSDNWDNDVEDICKLFEAGCNAVREVDEDIKVAVHFTDIQSVGKYDRIAQVLAENGIDYDVFASSYYPFWHGTTENVTKVLGDIAENYGKEVMVAEVSYGYTFDEGDTWNNTLNEWDLDSMDIDYDVSVQGQATAIRDVMQAVAEIGDAGLGVFYWEPAWIPVNVYEDGVNWDACREANKLIWEEYGSGWASSYAEGYDPEDAGQWHGGSSWDNQAMFDFWGKPLESLNVFKYVDDGVNEEQVKIRSVDDIEIVFYEKDTVALPDKIDAAYTHGAKVKVDVVWNEDDIDQINGLGIFVVKGTIDGYEPSVKCTIKVIENNLLENGGFENDKAGWTISGSGHTNDGFAPGGEEAREGEKCLHFSGKNKIDFTAEQTLKVDSGIYTFSAYIQGDNLGSEEEVMIYAKVGGEELTAKAEKLTGWRAWKTPTLQNIIVENDNTSITVGMSVKGNQGGWGTIDDMYLRKVAEVDAAVKSVKVTPAAVTLKLGNTITTNLKAEVTTAGNASKAVKWSSDNDKVATVDSDGKVTAKSAGTAKITATSVSDNTKKDTATITVEKADVSVTKVTMNMGTKILAPGKTVKLKASVAPSNATNKKITWKSKNTNVATVKNGTVTASKKKTGTARITATAANGKTAECKVIVVSSAKAKKQAVSKVNIKKNVTLYTKKASSKKKPNKITLKPTISPKTAKNKKVTWSSSNPKVATVNSKGKITAKAKGTATITVKTKEGNRTAKCTVKVKNK